MEDCVCWPVAPAFYYPSSWLGTLLRRHYRMKSRYMQDSNQQAKLH
jgi:superfamily I DNA and/or RNA helicase